MIKIVAAALLLAACSDENGAASAAPATPVQSFVAQPRSVFTPAAPPAAAPAPAPGTVIEAPSTPPRLGIAAEAQTAPAEGNARAGRDFAFDNCRPCHVVAPNQQSAVRFANAPDFRAIANMPSTTPFSLTVWLTNPHPTMPSLILSAKESADVVAYILSLRTPPK